ncbi:hypothetical protein BBO99_00007577 [Phytophthora kernoviae]|uniref:Uncharacterized protein n=2 Tax=Phytophthora kernoviae TaxID=325452 RepID=A0A3R7J1E0_9STRA|nr:hypothetical protein G195_008244 [Phytophthora kernoviae 00238/432]KAG2518225.1 hypothetical protein JM16_007213 [Phytophthora kernoviae]KAG2520062.1 hypothetical protein JM18_007297 [Phytophthora kernoviae]RLN06150.1 hypothetical protein BBI17_007363 [Phytophthora kernoviae]RLN76412.1 hypothetical protein BBO99_00007577 [Phytophthora kernoviae]
MADGALLYSCAVYLYAYDADQGSYLQQTDAAVGCALLANDVGDSFSLLLYDTQKTPLLQLPVTPSARFVPQKDNYVNFYERSKQRNYAMRFKDAATSENFLTSVAYTKAQVFLHSTKAFDQGRSSKPIVMIDQLSLGKEDTAPLVVGDVAGITLKKWQGTVDSRRDFFTSNPMEIAKQQKNEETSGSEVRRIKLVEGEARDADPFVHVLATEALLGMQKMTKRLVTVTFPDTQEWMIAEMELVKVKKNTRSIKRMASLSRMGSQSSGLIASVKTMLDSRVEANGGEVDTPMSRSSSLSQQTADPRAGYVPVLLAGLQLPGERPGSLRSLAVETNEVQTNVHSEVAPQSSSSSLAAKVFEPLKASSTALDVDVGSNLQEVNARLQEANGELESNMEDLQSQQESLQVENRTLLDKLQNGNHLQQEKFRLELRGVQHQLSHTQEQMMVYQEENFQLRTELAAKDEQLAKEKVKLQEDMHKQLEQLQRQVEDEVRQGSKTSIERMATEKAALEARVAEMTAQQQQWEIERDMMNKRLSQAQSQQVQLQDETAKSQATQNSRVQELLSQIQELENESVVLKKQAEGYHSEAQHLEELLVSKDQEMAQMQTAKNDQEYAALSELFKEFMNDIYFHFQDAFDEDTEFTGKEIVMAIRKILKQNTMDILGKLEEFYHQQALRH